ncbi:MAG TPA: GntR family transcriptional regulator [Acetobacteraceae bacterium]|nr:GntR family transcriptional regulator [Acetobacteraceae bacterium]
MRQFFDPYPKYLQVRRILLNRIEQAMRPGEQLPTEHALCAEFAVSRETVRAALAALERDGIIRRTPGRGTFIARMPRARPETRLTGLTEDFSALKLDTEARVLESGPARLPASVCDMLGLEAEMPAYRIARLRWFERKPLAWIEGWMPEAVGEAVARLDLRRTSIRRELRETLRIPILEDHQGIEAVAADTRAAELLQVPIGAPLLCLTRLFLTEGGAFAVYFRSLYRADRYYYTVKLAQPGRAGGTRREARQGSSRRAGR